jgi:cytochrome c oxidase subunit 2
MTRVELMTLGKRKYEQICSACHKSDGKGLPPLYPALKRSSIALGWPVSRHIDIIFNGIPGSAMQSYKDQLTDEEVAAITTYERNAWGNNTDDVIQPEEVAALRNSTNKQPTLVNKVKAGGFQ